MGLLTAISFIRRQAPWGYTVAQLLSTLGLLGFVAGHWSLDVRYSLGRAWLVIWVMVFAWELFFLAHRLVAVLPRTSGEDALAARVEVVWLLARGVFIAPAIISGAAFAFRIWF